MTLALCVAAPLTGAMVVALIGDRLGRRGMPLAVGASLALACLATLVMAQAFASGWAAFVVDLGPWLPIRGSALSLAATPGSIPLLLAAAGAPALLIGAVARSGPSAGAGRSFYAGAAVFAAAVALISVAGDLVLLAAGWQLAGVATHLLMDGGPGRADGVPRSGRALAVHRAGDMAFALAIASFVALFSTSDIGEIARRVDLPLPDGALARIAVSLALPSVLVIAGVVGTAAGPLRSVIAAWRGAPAVTRAVAAVVAAAPAVIVLVRLVAILHPGVVAVGVVTAVAVAALADSVGVLARANQASARAPASGIEGALERAGRFGARVIGVATALVHRTERSSVGAGEAVVLAAALGLLAYWTVR